MTDHSATFQNQHQTPPVGFEPLQKIPGNTAKSGKGGTQGGTVAEEVLSAAADKSGSGETPAGLQEIVALWPSIPKPLRRVVLQLIYEMQRTAT